ncbi:hypothetical protein OC844_007576 [Tilletia horrida]|nr:hypothetical protein OC844_007576 [Tilletia horrida]
MSTASSPVAPKPTGIDSKKTEKAAWPPLDWHADDFALEFKLVSILHDFDAYRKVWWCQKGESHPNENKTSAGKGLAAQLLKDTPLAKHVQDSTSESLKYYGTRIVQKIDQKAGRGMAHLYLEARKELKITGNGVKTEDQLSDESANLWVKVKKRVPWYFEIASLIGSRLDVGTEAVTNSTADGTSKVLAARNQAGKKKKGGSGGGENIEMVDDEFSETDSDDGAESEGDDGEETAEGLGEAEEEPVIGKEKGKTREQGRTSSGQSASNKRQKPLEGVFEYLKARDAIKTTERQELLAFEKYKIEAEQALEDRKLQLEMEKQKTAQLEIQRLLLERELSRPGTSASGRSQTHSFNP